MRLKPLGSIVAFLYITIAISLLLSRSSAVQGQASFDFDLTAESVTTIVGVPYEFTVVLRNTGDAGSDVQNVIIFALFEEYGSGKIIEEVIDLEASYVSYYADGTTDKIGTLTGVIVDVKTDVTLGPVSPGTYKTFNVTFPSDVILYGSGGKIEETFTIISHVPGTTHIVLYAWGQDPIGPVHNSLDKEPDNHITVGEVEPGKYKGVFAIVEETQSVVPEFTWVLPTITSLATSGYLLLKRKFTSKKTKGLRR